MLSPAKSDAYYRVLDLEPGANEEQINDSWKLLVNAWHPDKFADSLKEKATVRLQSVNNARDELNRYWRRYREPPPSHGDFQPRAAPASPPGSHEQRARWPDSPAQARAPRGFKPGWWRGVIVRAFKWLVVCSVLWLFRQPIQWQEGEVALIQGVFWLMLVAGSAQLAGGIASACLGVAPARRRR
jgi:hypothetical protein